MSAPINLNKARKARAKADAKTAAAENRIRFGRTRAQKSRDDAEAAKAAQTLDAHRRER